MMKGLNGIFSVLHPIAGRHFLRYAKLLAIILPAMVNSALDSSASSRQSIKISLDSAYIIMGKQTGLTVDVADHSSSPGHVVVPFDSLPSEIEFVDNRNLPELSLESESNGKRILKTVYKIQSFDSGVYRIPPLMYINGTDTAFSNAVTLKVVPVDVAGFEDINPSEEVLSIGSRWYDIFPDWLTDYFWYFILALVIIAGGIYAYLILSKKVTVKIIPQKKELPPYIVAMKRLEHLKQEQLWEKGQDKAFYTELTEILREYLDKRFGINAMEMTSTQIIKAISSREDTVMSKELMKQILEMADYVKFARVRPLREDNIKSFEAACQFVEDTKPAEQEPSDKREEATNSEPK